MTDEQVSSTSPTGQQVLDLPMPEDHDETDAKTIREYLIILLSTLWEQGYQFSAKRPFVNSGWNSDLYEALVHAGFISGRLDEDGFLAECDDEAGHRLIASAIKSLGKSGQPR